MEADGNEHPKGTGINVGFVPGFVFMPESFGWRSVLIDGRLSLKLAAFEFSPEEKGCIGGW